MSQDTCFTRNNYSLHCVHLFDTIKVMRYTFKDFKAEYPNDKACLLAVLENRYGNTCPRCGVIGVKFHPITGRKAFVCSECDKHIYPLAETIFRKSETSLWNWFYAIYLFSTSKNGVSAKELERHLGVTYKTAWRMAKQIRLLMHETGKVGRDKPVEIDETFIGGKPKAHQRADDRPPKEIVLGMVERNGRIRAHRIAGTGSKILIPAVKRGVYRGTQTYTDEYAAYRSLKWEGYPNRRVNHGKLEYVRGMTHTNTIEGSWSQLKRSIDGTYHSVSPKYLQSYVNEFVFRYNHRTTAVCPLLLERAAKLS